MSQARELTQQLDQRPERNMAEGNIALLAHGDRQNPKARSHRQILMLIRLLSTARSLMMNTLRCRNVEYFPLAAQPITKIEIFTGRAARKEGRESTHQFECLAPQRTRATADPFARYRLFRCRWKSVWERCPDQLSRFESFDLAVQQSSVQTPEECRRSHRLIGESAHRCAHSRVGPDRFEEFFNPMRINLNVVIDQ